MCLTMGLTSQVAMAAINTSPAPAEHQQIMEVGTGGEVVTGFCSCLRLGCLRLFAGASVLTDGMETIITRICTSINQCRVYPLLYGGFL